jgi:hypothetical protein
VIDLRAWWGRSLIALMIFPITGFERLFGFFNITVKRLTELLPNSWTGSGVN